MDRFKAKLARWRAKFRPLKARVDALEREVADLEAKASRSSPVGTAPPEPIRDKYGVIVGYRGGGSGGPRPLHEGEAARLRLPRAREKLAGAKQELAHVESQARREGIAPGQLY
jgi:BMFP domain-containing protein YqiC